MTRLVRGADGRQWMLHRRMTWRTPATVDDFEHDVGGGAIPMVMMGVLVALLAVVLVAWTPNKVIVPGWLVLIVVILVAFIPVRWVLRRPWTLVAETDEDPNDERPAEHWVGTVHGVHRSGQELSRTAREIEHEALPHPEGPLHQVE